MDSQKKDELSDRKREEALARLMGEALDRLASRNASECPDAEAIAAYQDQALDPSEMSQCESHFADCTRCRKILALLAASTDAPLAEKEVAHLGELIAAAVLPSAPASQSRTAPRPIKSAWKTRWLAPALGIAAVLALWFAVRPPWRSQEQSATGTLIAQAPRSEPPKNAPITSVQEFSKMAPQKKSESDSISRKAQPVTKNELSAPPSEPLSKSLSAATNAARPVTPSAGGDNLKLNNESKSKAVTSRSPGPGLPPPPAASLQAQVRRDSTPMEAPRSEAHSGMVGGASSAKEATAGAVPNAPTAEKQAAQAQGRVSPAPLTGRSYSNFAALDAARKSSIQIKTPLGTILWRAGRGGSIQRSTDAGGTWIAQASPSQEDWLAGAAVSDTICWIVGRNGAIARTTDGEHWEKIGPPALTADSSGKLVDWISVTASSAQAAAITADNQLRYTTQDGGKTWQAQ